MSNIPAETDKENEWVSDDDDYKDVEDEAVGVHEVDDNEEARTQYVIDRIDEIV